MGFVFVSVKGRSNSDLPYPVERKCPMICITTCQVCMGYVHTHARTHALLCLHFLRMSHMQLMR